MRPAAGRHLKNHYCAPPPLLPPARMPKQPRRRYGRGALKKMSAIAQAGLKATLASYFANATS